MPASVKKLRLFAGRKKKTKVIKYHKNLFKINNYVTLI